MKRREEKKRRFRGGVLKAAEKQQKRSSQYGYLKVPRGINIFRESAGTFLLDILPYTVKDDNHPDRDDEYGIAVPGELWYKRPYKLHRNVGPENVSAVCPTSVGKRCPICEYRAKLLKEGARWDDETVRALKPSDRNIYIVVPRKHKEFPEEPHLWDISRFLFEDKLVEELKENEDYESFPDPEEGYTLRVRFSENTFQSNTYYEVSRIDFVERDRSYSDLLDQLPCLDDVLDVKSYDELETIFLGGDLPDAEDGKEEEDDNDDDNDEDDGEDDDEDDDDDEDEDENKPSQSRQTRPSRRTLSSNKCPYGHKYGVDVDQYKDCEKCDVWEACFDAAEDRED